MSNIKVQVCSWCGRRGVRGDGSGQFMDTDVNPGRDFFYPAIPICSGCGGLGVEINSDEFRALAQKVYEYRFKYYPVDKYPEPPVIVPYKYLKLLIATVEEIVQKFGSYGVENCYAKWFIRPNGVFKTLLDNLEEMVKENIQSIKTEKPQLSDDQAERNRVEMLAIFSGDFDKGFNLFEDHLKACPDNSTLWHDFTILQMLILRTTENIDEYWKKATAQNPAKALHFFQAGKYYWNIAQDPFRALTYLNDAKSAPDWADFQVAEGVGFDELVKLISEEIYFSHPYKYA